MSPLQVALVFVGIPLVAVAGIWGAVLLLGRPAERTSFPVLGVPEHLQRQPDWSSRGRPDTAGEDAGR